MEIFDKVTAILSELSGMENICLEQELQRDLALDSIQMVMLIIKLEESFQITFDESEMNPFDLISVCHVVDLVEKYVDGCKDENQEENCGSTC